MNRVVGRRSSSSTLGPWPTTNDQRPHDGSTECEYLPSPYARPAADRHRGPCRECSCEAPHAALHRHFDRRSNLNRAGTRGKIGVEGRVVGKLHVHVAGTSMNVPAAALRTFGGHVAAAGLAVKSALHAANGNVARAGMQIDVARPSLFDLDIAAARAAADRAGNLPRPNIARTSLHTQFTGHIRQLCIARSGLQIDVAARAFNDQIARAGMCANDGIGGHRDLVVDRNVFACHVVNVNAVAILPQRRMLLDLVNVGFAAARQPVITDINLPANKHRSRSPARTVTSPERVSTSRSTGPLT